MPYLVAGLILLGAVSTVNLLLTLGLIRRLREQNATPQAPVPRVVLGIGERPAEFTALTTGGGRLDRDTVAGSLIGFFTPHCPPCHDRVPEFVAYAAAGVPAVAVLAGQADEVDALRRTLDGSVRIVVEDHGGPLHSAFAVRGLPALCLLDRDGTVVASGTSLVTFPVPTAV